MQMVESVLNLAQGWNAVEWNVFGDCCGSQAIFSAGSTLVVRTSVNTSINNFPPTCLEQGFSGETNNLFLVETPTPQPTSTLAAIVFMETNAAHRAPTSCTGTARAGRIP
jgi:hypothetical protein